MGNCCTNNESQTEASMDNKGDRVELDKDNQEATTNQHGYNQAGKFIMKITKKLL